MHGQLSWGKWLHCSGMVNKIPRYLTRPHSQGASDAFHLFRAFVLAKLDRWNKAADMQLTAPEQAFMKQVRGSYPQLILVSADQITS